MEAKIPKKLWRWRTKKYFGSGDHSIDAIAYNTFQKSVPAHLQKRVVVRTGGTVITFLYSKRLLERCGVLVNNNCNYLLSTSILSFDPKYSNKDMFVLEVVFKEVTLDGEPIIFPGVFTFSKQDSVTFNEILDMLLQAEPSLRQAPWVFSDGCKTPQHRPKICHLPSGGHSGDRLPLPLQAPPPHGLGPLSG